MKISVEEHGKVQGRIHSIESFGTVDGPGIRYVVFFQGCPLRCIYCHNPDSWQADGGSVETALDVVTDVKKYSNFIRKGGLTLSGGEPLFQPEFANAIIEICHNEGIHVAIDTSGAVPLSVSKDAVRAADLILLDIKAIDASELLNITGNSQNYALDILALRESIKMPVWIRYVLVPGYTMDKTKVGEIAKLLSQYKCVEKIQLLPFHQMGIYKWEEIGVEYTLSDVEAPSANDVAEVTEIFKRNGLITE